MQHLEVSGAVRHIYMPLGFKRLITPVGIKFLPVKRMGDLYRFDIADTKRSNQIVPSTTTRIF